MQKFTSILMSAVFIANIGWTCDTGGAAKAVGKAPLLTGLGNHKIDVTINNKVARKYFNQGLILTYGFNHAEAARSFRDAALLDPDCGMCYWGEAYVLGPNINLPMEKEAYPLAFEALQKAIALKDKVSEKEKDLIEALEKRYTNEALEDRSHLDQNYAQAMRIVAKKYPTDSDIQTLLAESLMDLHPWDYWTQKERKPHPWTQEIVATLEKALELNPKNPGANHLYIHAVEASPYPEKALKSAKRLDKITPGAGHLVHMPSHIYIRTGDYHAGSKANQNAIDSDDSYFTQCHAQGVYPLAYYPHNYHFLWATASMEGRKELAMKTARAMQEKIDTNTMRMSGLETLQHYWIIPVYSMVRFALWDDILKEREPDGDLLYPLAIWHYARGIAFTEYKNIEKAKAELKALDAIKEDPALKPVTIWGINEALTLVTIASHVLNAEIAAKEGRKSDSISHYEAAIAQEDTLKYNEPPDWFFPVRHSLGAAFLDAGKAVQAELVYREDLKNFPKNGWSLYGLAKALEAQGKLKEAKHVKKQFKKAWKHADIELSSSRI